MTITKSFRALMLAVPFFAVACGGSPAAPAAPAGGGTGASQTKLDVEILGGGTVTYNPATGAPCTSPGSAKLSCPSITFQGAGSVTATPAPGFVFFGWSLTFAGSSNTLINPLSATQNIVPGTSVALTVTFLRAGPITATFTSQDFSTLYFVPVDNPAFDPIKAIWSGPNCGEFGPQGEQEGGVRGSTASLVFFAMTWKHPHPPCGATTDHRDAKIEATITFKDRVFVCEYQGSETGEGPACQLVR